MKTVLALLAATLTFAASAAVQEVAHYNLEGAGGIRDTAAPMIWKSLAPLAALLLSPLAALHAADIPEMPRTVIPAQSEGKAVPQAAMEKVYGEVKTPFKYGIVVRGEEGQNVDCPTIFRQKGHWYMVYVGISPNKKANVGYETYLARSADLLHWEKLGKIMSFGSDGWDRWQVDGGIALCDPT